MISSDNTASSTQSDQLCEAQPIETIDRVETTETIGQVDPICQHLPNSVMMPPHSGGLITLGIVIAGLLSAIAEVLRETSGFIRTWRNDDHDQDK